MTAPNSRRQLSYLPTSQESLTSCQITCPGLQRLVLTCFLTNLEGYHKRYLPLVTGRSGLRSAILQLLSDAAFGGWLGRARRLLLWSPVARERSLHYRLKWAFICYNLRAEERRGEDCPMRAREPRHIHCHPAPPSLYFVFSMRVLGRSTPPTLVSSTLIYMI